MLGFRFSLYRMPHEKGAHQRELRRDPMIKSIALRTLSSGGLIKDPLNKDPTTAPSPYDGGKGILHIYLPIAQLVSGDLPQTGVNRGFCPVPAKAQNHQSDTCA